MLFVYGMLAGIVVGLLVGAGLTYYYSSKVIAGYKEAAAMAANIKRAL